MDPDPYCIRIQEVPGSVLGRFLEPYTDPDPHMQIEDKMEANDVRFKIIKQFRDSSDIQFLYVTECAYSEKKDLIKLFLIFSSKLRVLPWIRIQNQCIWIWMSAGHFAPLISGTHMCTV